MQPAPTSVPNVRAGANRPARTYEPVGSGPLRRTSKGSPRTEAIPRSQRPSGGCSALSRKTSTTTSGSRKCRPFSRRTLRYSRPGRTSSGSSTVRPGPSRVRMTAIAARTPHRTASRPGLQPGSDRATGRRRHHSPWEFPKRRAPVVRDDPARCVLPCTCGVQAGRPEERPAVGELIIAADRDVKKMCRGVVAPDSVLRVRCRLAFSGRLKTCPGARSGHLGRDAGRRDRSAGGLP